MMQITEITRHDGKVTITWTEAMLGTGTPVLFQATRAGADDWRYDGATTLEAEATGLAGCLVDDPTVRELEIAELEESMAGMGPAGGRAR
jgi:hypothetical protein